MLLLVIVMLTGLSFLGGFTIGGWTSKPVRLYSDLTRGLTAEEDDFPDDSVLWAQIQAPIRPVETAPAQTAPTETAPAEPVSRTGGVPIEDFSADGSGLSHFFDALRRREELSRPIRIAFLGDSFVEGDILTSDLREHLQELYGGRGVGFVPLAPVDLWRNTLNIEHGGWKISSSLYGEQRGAYLFNGQCFTPEEGEAYTSVRATDQREHAKAFNTASLFYSTTEPATVVYNLGRSGEKEAALRTGGLQLFTTTRANMRMADFRVTAGEGFTGYGLFLNDETGVYVDNYSLRSSSGMQLLRIGPNLLAQMNRLIPTDLVILQYGLNVMDGDRRDYQSYVDQMIRVVNRIKEAMPEASILIFGVADRNFRNDEGEMVTKPGVISFVEAQRKIAQETGVTFWNTYLAMGGRNSMGTFVNRDPAWANKDYTHINYLGGRRIGLSFAESLVDAGSRYE